CMLKINSNIALFRHHLHLKTHIYFAIEQLCYCLLQRITISRAIQNIDLRLLSDFKLRQLPIHHIN
ncbi:unnamed protein product, partial [Rotaria sp. Silwood2]